MAALAGAGRPHPGGAASGDSLRRRADDAGRRAALIEGRLARLRGPALPDAEAYVYWWVCPPDLVDWPPLMALHDWLFEEIAASAQALRARG